MNPRNPLDAIGPPSVRDALTTLRDALVRDAGERISGLVLWGDLAAGHHAAGRTRVSVAVILRDTSPATLTAIAPALRAAYRQAQVEPLLLRADEVSAAADVFPSKFLDIKARNVVLHGEDPFAALTIDPRALRFRTEQELRNLALRLRRRIVDGHGDATEAWRALREISGAVGLALHMALTVLDGGAPAPHALPELLDAASSALGLDPAALRPLAQAGGGEPNASPAALLAAVLHAVEVATARVDALEAP